MCCNDELHTVWIECKYESRLVYRNASIIQRCFVDLKHQLAVDVHQHRGVEQRSRIKEVTDCVANVG